MRFLSKENQVTRREFLAKLVQIIMASGLFSFNFNIFISEIGVTPLPDLVVIEGINIRQI